MPPPVGLVLATAATVTAHRSAPEVATTERTGFLLLHPILRVFHQPSGAKRHIVMFLPVTAALSQPIFLVTQAGTQVLATPPSPSMLKPGVHSPQVLLRPPQWGGRRPVSFNYLSQKSLPRPHYALRG